MRNEIFVSQKITSQKKNNLSIKKVLIQKGKMVTW